MWEVRAQAEADATASLAREQVPVKIDTALPRAERQKRIAQLRERVTERAEAATEAAEIALEEANTPREAVFAILLTKLFREAAWVLRTHQFPDGQPLRTQHRWRVEIWEIFITALERRMNGDTGQEASDGGTSSGIGS